MLELLAQSVVFSGIIAAGLTGFVIHQKASQPRARNKAIAEAEHEQLKSTMTAMFHEKQKSQADLYEMHTQLARNTENRKKVQVALQELDDKLAQERVEKYRLEAELAELRLKARRENKTYVSPVGHFDIPEGTPPGLVSRDETGRITNFAPEVPALRVNDGIHPNKPTYQLIADEDALFYTLQNELLALKTPPSKKPAPPIYGSKPDTTPAHTVLDEPQKDDMNPDIISKEDLCMALGISLHGDPQLSVEHQKDGSSILTFVQTKGAAPVRARINLEILDA
jgi:hypothetical protein